jgi:hypothetical protein
VKLKIGTERQRKIRFVVIVALLSSSPNLLLPLSTIMYSDLLDVLGGGNSLAGGAGNRESEKHVAVSFKAGKLDMKLQDNGKYWVTPDTRRGTVQLVWQDNQLKWEWVARREGNVVDSFNVTQGATFERIETPTGRIFLLSEPRLMYWLQDASDEKDDEVVVQVNQYLTNPQEAAPEGDSAGAAAGGDDALAQAIRASTSEAAPTSATGSSNNTNQVDALSNILENLGMPQQQGGASAGTTPTGTLTLADLQGAMQGLSATPSTSSGPPLQEVVTPEAITTLLEDEAVCNRLLELLPEEQRSMEHLEDNLRSPQIQQTLRSLTAALQPDDAGSMEGYNSVLANFQLNPADGEEALRSGNPIQAFLDCVLASVQKEEEKEEEESKDVMEE